MPSHTPGILNYQGICDSLDAEEKRLMKRVWEIPKLEKQRDALLAALEGLLDYEDDEPAEGTFGAEIYDQARAAINKAKGVTI